MKPTPEEMVSATLALRYSIKSILISKGLKDNETNITSVCLRLLKEEPYNEKDTSDVIEKVITKIKLLLD